MLTVLVWLARLIVLALAVLGILVLALISYDAKKEVEEWEERRK